jgi:hypothetical protein
MGDGVHHLSALSRRGMAEVDLVVFVPLVGRR